MNARINNKGQVLISFQGKANREVDLDGQFGIERGLLIDGRRVLDPAPGMVATPAALNDRGQIAGTAHLRHDWTDRQKRMPGYRRSRPPTSQVAFRIPPGRPLDLSRDGLGHLGEPDPRTGTSSTRAFGINSLGQAVGVSNVGISAVNGGPLGHAFRTAPDRPINPLTDDLGSLAPGQVSGATAINDLGQVVGSAPVFTARQGQQDHAFRTGPNRPINPLTDDLGTLGGMWSRASHINNRGDVAGTSRVDSTTTHAFLYTRQTMFDLNDCVEPARDQRE